MIKKWQILTSGTIYSLLSRPNEIKRPGRGKKKVVWATCLLNLVFLNSSLSTFFIHSMFQLHWIFHGTWSHMIVFVFLLLYMLFQPAVLVLNSLLPAELQHSIQISPSCEASLIPQAEKILFVHNNIMVPRNWHSLVCNLCKIVPHSQCDIWVI